MACTHLQGPLCLALLVLACIHGAGAQNVTLCWGNGSLGQLGNGLGNKSNVPVEVLGGHSFAAVCTGFQHSCAVEPSGKAWCWGSNEYGQLGNGSPTSSSAPVAVAGSHNFRSIYCGSHHNCALDEEGRAWCWGATKYRVQLRGTATGAETGSNSNVPMMTAGHTFTSLCAASLHNCGLEPGGQAFCWGDNTVGQLGANSTTNHSDTPIKVAGGHSFQTLTCGEAHTCALDGEGQAWCWGSNYESELGTGETAGADYKFNNDYRRLPVAVSGGHAFVVIAAGSYHTCAVSKAETMWCWGEYLGSMSTPELKQSTTPVVPAANSSSTSVAVSTGNEFTCGIMASGDAWCFGENAAGSLGDGTYNDSIVPVYVAGGHMFLSLGTSKAGKSMCGVSTRQASPMPASTSSSSSSSAPVGAIVGGIVGAAVVLAVLAFFALRPGKGWLRRKPATAAAGAGDGKWGKETPTPGSSTAGSSAALGGQQVMSGPSAAPPPAAAVSPLQAAWTSSSLGQDTFLPYSRAPPSSLAGPDTLLPYSRAAGAPPISQAGVSAPTEPAVAPPSNVSAAGWAGGSPQPARQPLPNSYLSSAGLAGGAFAAAAHGGALTGSQSSSAYSAASDPLLAFVNSYVGSQPAAALHQQQAALTPGSSGGSGALELRTDARVWEVQWPELTILRAVGHGSFGSVYLAEWNQVPVAVKVLIGKEDINRGRLELPERVLRELQAEAAVMSHMRHPNIVQFMGLVAVPPALITEYCSRGSLYDCLAAAREQPAAAALLTWRRRLGMAVDAGAGLLYLHRRSIIHRDIKSPNLLVDKDWNVKVADFNLSKLLEGARPESSLTSAVVTNPIWLAPEVLEGGTATTASDVYSFGMVLYELLTWRLPWTFANMTPFKVGATIRQGGRPEVPAREALPGPDTAGWAGLDAYVQLMRDCWAPRPEDRPSFDEVVGRLRRLLAETAGG